MGTHQLSAERNNSMVLNTLAIGIKLKAENFWVFLGMVFIRPIKSIKSRSHCTKLLNFRLLKSQRGLLGSSRKLKIIG